MSDNGPVVIDVLSDDSFGREHLPGAVNFCVYETAFVSKVTDAFPRKDTPLEICGYSSRTGEAELAVEKLKQAGYECVTVIEGGLERWKEEGGKVDGFGGESKQPDGRKNLDVESSFIRWTGRNLFNFHTGDLKLKSGFVELKDGALIAAEFDIDMNSISCSDLADSAMNRMLVDHLRTADFFDVGNYPVATFSISSAEPIPGVTDGLPNCRIKGGLMLRGKSVPLDFDALVAWKEDGAVSRRRCWISTARDGDRSTVRGNFSRDWGSMW